MTIIVAIISLVVYGFLVANLKSFFPTMSIGLRVILSLLLAAGTSIFGFIIWCIFCHFLDMDMPWEKGWELY